MRKFFLFSLLLISCSQSPGYNPSTRQGKYGGYLYLATTSDPKSFNPILAKETSTTQITSLIFEGLTRINAETLEVEPNLASRWDVSSDGKVWTFYLRKDVKWNDGEEFTADDVVFTFNQLIYNPQIPSSAGDILKIEGKPFKVEKIDKYTVRFTLPGVYAPFLMAMGQEILPKHKLEEIVKQGKFNTAWTLAEDLQNIVGTGPFMLKKYIPGQLIELKRNPYYWRKDKQGNQLPYLEGVRFIVVQNQDTALLKFLDKEVDYYPMRGEDFPLLKPLEKKEGFKIYLSGPAFGSNFIVFNQNIEVNPRTKKPYVKPYKLKWFCDKRFRQAISYALDRKSMIDIVLNGFGYPQYGPMSPSSGYFYNPDVHTYPYNPDKARQLLVGMGLMDRNKDGFLEDEQGHRVEFNLYTNAENPIRIKICEIIKHDLKKIGIKVNFLPLEFNNLVSKLVADYDWEAVVIGFTGGIEPHFGSNVWLSSGHLHAWYPKQKSPATWWEKELDEIFVKGVQILNKKERKELYDKWQEIASDELPLIYTVLAESMFAIRNKFGNLKPTPYGGAFHNIEKIYISIRR